MNTRVVDTANAICMAARQAKAKRARELAAVACECGKPAFFLGLCRECNAGPFTDLGGVK